MNDFVGCFLTGTAAEVTPVSEIDKYNQITAFHVRKRNRNIFYCKFVVFWMSVDEKFIFNFSIPTITSIKTKKLSFLIILILCKVRFEAGQQWKIFSHGEVECPSQLNSSNMSVIDSLNPSGKWRIATLFVCPGTSAKQFKSDKFTSSPGANAMIPISSFAKPQ